MQYIIFYLACSTSKYKPGPGFGSWTPGFTLTNVLETIFGMIV